MTIIGKVFQGITKRKDCTWVQKRVTILTCANATGDHKQQLTMIGKSKKLHALKDLNPRAYLLMYVGQSNAWIDCNIGLIKNLFLK